MNKTLRKLLVTGTIGLSAAGCVDLVIDKTLHGKVNGNEVVVQELVDGSNRSIMMEHKGSGDFNERYLIGRYLFGRDLDGNRTFESIFLDGVNVEKLKKLGTNFSNYPLFQYANSDSLNAVYREVLKQNRRED